MSGFIEYDVKEGRYGTDSNHDCFPFTAGTDSEKRAWA